MTCDFGINLKALRKQHGMTQKLLGDLLCVSTQAVSKWETGASYPDISLLPKIADVFGVTTDRLLCYNSRGKDEEIVRVCGKADECICKKMFAEAVSLMRELKEKHPCDSRVIYKLAWALRWQAHYMDDDAETYGEAITLYMQLLQVARDEKTRASVMHELMYCHQMIGDTDLALKYAQENI